MYNKQDCNELVAASCVLTWHFDN